MKTFRVDARLRNNLLIKAREALGYKSCPKAAAAIGISYGVLVQYESLKRSPWRADGTWQESAMIIANGYKVLPDMLWPAEIGGVKQTHVSMEIDAPEAAFLEAPRTPEQKLLEEGRTEVVGSAVSVLTPLERRILNFRFGLEGDEPKTYDELGMELGISRQRVTQIETRALGRLRDFVDRDGEPKPGLKELAEAARRAKMDKPCP